MKTFGQVITFPESDITWPKVTLWTVRGLLLTRPEY